MAALFSSQLSLILGFLCFLDVNIAINLDARFSIVKKGTGDSYFGYSVAQHQIVDEKNPDKIIQNVFLIGSPKKEGTGGAIYRCDASSPGEDCQQITEGLPSKARSSSELIDDQWLGVSTASQGTGKKAVACAHRYIKDNKALGVCHVFSQALDERRFVFQPCEKVSNNLFMQDFGLCQAGMSAAIGQVCAHRYVKDNAALGRCFQLTQGLEYDNPFIPCKGMENKKYMQDFGLCQAGMAVAMGQEDSLLMGAPGSVFWRGSVFLTNVTDELGVSQAEIVSPYKDPAKVSGNEQPTPTRSYTYQGYALTMGRFGPQKTLHYVSGALKGGNAGGSVVFYKVVEQPERSLHYDGDQIIQGPVAFSGFGSSLLALDMNNDGHDDLIAGAPYYYTKNCGGAFYVYLGGDEMINGQSQPTVVTSRKMGDAECQSLGCEHARFGMSLAKMGDVNMDSFQDFAVGAPYEGKGAVYIYHGKKDAPGFKTDFVQRIEASDLPQPFSNIVSFGHSLSGGMDLDTNGYPDLLVGAYESDVALLIRSRPIIRLFSTTDITPKRIDLEGQKSCNLSGINPEYKDRLCVAVEVCVNFTTKPTESIQQVPTVVYSLEAESNRRIARVELQNAQDTNKKMVTGQIMQLKKGETVCHSQIALIKSKFDDKLNPVEFTYIFKLSTDDQGPSPYPTSATQDINQFPILETEDATDDTITGQNDVAIKIDFVKECGPDQLCESDLQFDPRLGGVVKDDEGNYELLIQTQNTIDVNITVHNQGEAAYLTRVYIQKPFAVTYLDTRKEETSLVSCSEDKTLIWCDQIGNPLRKGEGVAFSVLLNVPKELAESTDLHNITTWVNTSSTELTPDEDKVVMFFRVINRADIILSASVYPDNSILCEGEPRAASTITTEDEIGASVRHHYWVRNNGPGIISESYITIYWPFEVTGVSTKERKYLLYLMEEPRVTGPVTQCNYKEIEPFVNPLNIQRVAPVAPQAIQLPTNLTLDGSSTFTYKTDEDDKSRTRREAVEPKKRSDGVIVMSCQDKSARCFEFKCKLGKLEPGIQTVQIVMEARLWESTLLTHYRKAPDVQIISWGNVILPKNSMIQQKDTSNDQQKAITRAIPDFKEVSGQKIKWWIILVAVIVGIVLLLVVIFILYKIGFFRRKRPDEMKMYKAEKKNQAMLTDYDDREL